MKNIFILLSHIRFQPAVSALIHVNELMGIPRYLHDNFLFVPFFTEKDGTYRFSSSIILLLPSLTIYYFRREITGCVILTPRQDMLDFKHYAIQSQYRYPLQDIPESLRPVYSTIQEDVLCD